MDKGTASDKGRSHKAKQGLTVDQETLKWQNTRRGEGPTGLPFRGGRHKGLSPGAMSIRVILRCCNIIVQ
jgi:hypothetical protein